MQVDSTHANANANEADWKRAEPLFSVIYYQRVNKFKGAPLTREYADQIVRSWRYYAATRSQMNGTPEPVRSLALTYATMQSLFKVTWRDTMAVSNAPPYTDDFLYENAHDILNW